MPLGQGVLSMSPEGPRVDLGHIGEVMPVGWPGNSSEFPWMSWRRSRGLCLGCYSPDADRKRMDVCLHLAEKVAKSHRHTAVTEEEPAI